MGSNVILVVIDFVSVRTVNVDELLIIETFHKKGMFSASERYRVSTCSEVT